MIRLCWVVIGSVMWVSTVQAGADEDAVERVLLAEAKSSATFAETRDTQAVLKLYTNDYKGVQDGEAETRESIEKWLSEYGSALDQGSRVHFLGAVSNAQERGKCTSVLRKESSGWLIQHEHCSKTKPQGMER